MTKKTLSEAAAEILKASASGAPAEARKSLESEADGARLGRGQDLGGDVPQRVAAENPDGVTGVSAKEPGPAPKVGSDPKKKLKSNNSGVSIDKQKQGTNTVTVDAYHKTKSDQQEQVAQDDEVLAEGDEDGEFELYTDGNGNFFDAEGNQLELTAEEVEALTEALAAQDEDESDDSDDGEQQEQDSDAGEESNAEEVEESVILFDREAIYEQFREELDSDLGSLLSEDSGLSEEFKNKVRTIFEAAVMARVDHMADALEEAFVSTLAESIEEIKGDLTEKTNDYLSYVAEEWLKDNELAVEQGLRTELTEDFITGLKSLFQEHYIDIPEDKVNVVEELTEEVAQVEAKLNEALQKSVDLAKQVKSYQASDVFATVCENLTDVQVDKMRSLAEGVEFTTADEFKGKLEMLRDNYFSGKATKATETPKSDGGLNEAVEIEDEAKKKAPSVDPMVDSFMDALDRASNK